MWGLGPLRRRCLQSRLRRLLSCPRDHVIASTRRYVGLSQMLALALGAMGEPFILEWRSNTNVWNAVYEKRGEYAVWFVDARGWRLDLSRLQILWY